MSSLSTNADCTYPSLPPFQSPATDPVLPGGIEDEEVVMLDVVSPASTTENPCTPTVNARKSTAAKKDSTEVSNIVAFFNPLANTAKKPRCNMLRGCFQITPDPSCGMIVECKNCIHFGVSNRVLFKRYVFCINSNSLLFLNSHIYIQTRKWKHFNATFARGHALQCPGVAIEVRARLLQNSQAGRLQKKMTLLTPRTNSTLGGESLSSVRKSADLGNKRLKQTTLIRNTEDGKVTMMSIGEMSRVYSAEVEAVLYRHEPLTRLLDPMVIAALTLRHPPMKSFIPQNCDTIYTNYVLPIDIATTSELVKYVGLLPGMVTVSFDGVTANRKSKVR